MAELLDRPGPHAVPILDPEGAAATPPAGAEVRVLEAVQGAIARPPVVRVARGMSLFGEHAAGWLAVGT
ncbi:MAG: phosphatase PAP2 family protein, partial [Pseudonocardia sp.]